MKVKFEQLEPYVALITINRPEVLNAMDREVYQLLSQAWQRVRDDPEIRVAIITGAGDRAFTVGADIKDYLGREGEMYEFWQTQRNLLLNRGLEVWKPVIAAVNGYCLGGGMTLLFATDVRFASTGARFGLSEVKRGILPGNGGTQRALQQLPYPVAMHYLLTGEMFDAQTALRYGLVNAVVPPEQLMDAALQEARMIASNPPLATQAIKELAVRSRTMHFADGLRLEEAMLKILQSTEDAKEGRLAFIEKREAHFRGR